MNKENNKPKRKILEIFSRVSLDEKIFFTKNLQVMIKAGIPFSDSLKALALQTKNKKLKRTIENIHQDIENGSTLAESLVKYPHIFPELYVNMVRAGEESGKLESVLDQLAIQLKKTRDLNSKIKGALVYPIFILCATIGIGVFMLIFVFPKILSLFSEIQITLPLTTRILIKISSFVSSKGWLFLAILIVIIILFLRIIRSKKGRRSWHRLLLKFPIVSPIIKKVNLAQFSRTFSSLLRAGLGLVRTLEISAGVVGNIIYREKILEVSERVKEGISVSEVLEKSPNLFPPTVVQMIKVGEQTGTLDNILEDITQFYEDDIERTMASLSSVIEPVLIILLGIVVGLLAVAILKPMYSLYQQF